MSVYNFDIKEIAEEYLHYYVNIFLKSDIIDVERLESNLHRDCDFHQYIPFGLMEEICKQLLKSNYKLINMEQYINHFELQGEKMKNNEVVIEFCGYNGICNITGYMYLEEAEDEKPLNFYNKQGFECGNNYPTNPYNEYEDKRYDAYEQLKEAMQTDELLIQYLVDYANGESVCIQREGYKLKIN